MCHVAGKSELSDPGPPASKSSFLPISHMEIRWAFAFLSNCSVFQQGNTWNVRRTQRRRVGVAPKAVTSLSEPITSSCLGVSNDCISLLGPTTAMALKMTAWGCRGTGRNRSLEQPPLLPAGWYLNSIEKEVLRSSLGQKAPDHQPLLTSLYFSTSTWSSFNWNSLQLWTAEICRRSCLCGLGTHPCCFPLQSLHPEHHVSTSWWTLYLKMISLCPWNHQGHLPQASSHPLLFISWTVFTSEHMANATCPHVDNLSTGFCISSLLHWIFYQSALSQHLLNFQSLHFFPILFLCLPICLTVPFS